MVIPFECLSGQCWGRRRQPSCVWVSSAAGPDHSVGQEGIVSRMGSVSRVVQSNRKSVRVAGSALCWGWLPLGQVGHTCPCLREPQDGDSCGVPSPAGMGELSPASCCLLQTGQGEESSGHCPAQLPDCCPWAAQPPGHTLLCQQS